MPLDRQELNNFSRLLLNDATKCTGRSDVTIWLSLEMCKMLIKGLSQRYQAENLVDTIGMKEKQRQKLLSARNVSCTWIDRSNRLLTTVKQQRCND